MEENVLKKLYLPSHTSHKGQNGRLLIIGGSELFHSASLWSLEVASRIVDLVHYASTDENNELVLKLKEEFRDGIVVNRLEIDEYIKEDDCILIGPGMVRVVEELPKIDYLMKKIKEIAEIEHEGMLTYHLTKYLLKKYPDKKWVIDAGSLQMMDPIWIPEGAILTPHHQEFELLISKIRDQKSKQIMKNLTIEEKVKWFAKVYHCAVLLKGEVDLVASEKNFMVIKGGNAGMTKGGTGDVLAGLVAALYCKNDAFTSAVSASIINKTAGGDLYKTKGYWFNASDLANQIPETMKRLLI